MQSHQSGDCGEVQGLRQRPKGTPARRMYVPRSPGSKLHEPMKENGAPSSFDAMADRRRAIGDNIMRKRPILLREGGANLSFTGSPPHASRARMRCGVSKIGRGPTEFGDALGDRLERVVM
jgi:hypothetical protein